jgi:hypothetical protein
MAQTIRQRAVSFAKDEIMRATESQEVEVALANHDEFGPWLGDDLGLCQSVIREAEKSLGDRVPHNYA